MAHLCGECGEHGTHGIACLLAQQERLRRRDERRKPTDVNPWWSVAVLVDDDQAPLFVVGLVTEEDAEQAVELLRASGLWAPCLIVAPNGATHPSRA